MRNTFYLTASALAALATAQTFTDCDPTKATCANDKAMPAKFDTTFVNGAEKVVGWKQTAGTLKYVDDGAEFTVSKKGEAPTIQSEGYLHFGYIEVEMKAAPGAGIISSIVLQSNDLDEVDWEFVGSVNSNVQMNYFGKGNTTTYDRMIEGPVSNAQEFHKYALNWTAEAITWIIDDKPVRTLKYAEANGGKNFPQTPSNVRIGIWAGGDSENQGTRDWAGGAPDYSKAPFTQTVKNIKIVNYSPGTEYQWTDKSGSYKSIKVIGAAKSQDTYSAIDTKAPTATAAPLASAIDAPSGNVSTTCTEGKASTTSAPKPTGGNGHGNGTDEACDCDTLTVTVTGTPPATNTPIPVKSSSTLPVSSASKPATTAPASSSHKVSSASKPATTANIPATTPAPYPVVSTGIKTDTRPVPSATIPVVPTGGVAAPTGGNGTTPPATFQGAASSNGVATALFGIVGAVMAMVF